MLRNKDNNALRMLFSTHNYVMTTAELTASKLYYADDGLAGSSVCRNSEHDPLHA